MYQKLELIICEKITLSNQYEANITNERLLLHKSDRFVYKNIYYIKKVQVERVIKYVYGTVRMLLHTKK